MFTVADIGRDRYTLTQQRTAVAARVLFCTLYLRIADFPRNIKVYSYIRRSLSAPQSGTGFPIFDGRLQDKSNEGMNK